MDHKSKKNHFEVSSFSMQQQWTITWSDCDMRWKVDCIQQPAMTSSVVGLRKSSKALPKAKLSPKMVMITIWWSAASLIHYSFLNPGKTIPPEKYAQQIDEMNWKITVRAAGICQQKGPNSSPQQHLATQCTANISKVEQIGLWSFASSAIFTWPLTNWLPLLQASQ